MSTPLVSVLIITRDRFELLTECLGAILAGSYRPIEIVLVDNGSPATRAAIADHLADLQTDCPIQHAVSPPASFSRLRQLAFDHAHGEFLLSIDDDCLAEPDAIANLVRRFQSDEKIGIVGGELTNVGFQGAQRFKGRGRFGENAVYEPVRDTSKADVFGGGNTSLRRAALQQAGGYDPRFTTALEDADAVLNIRRLGFRMVYDPEVRITHRHSPAIFRNPWRNLALMRLLLLFKHFRPTGLAGWGRFLHTELGLLNRDLGNLTASYRLKPRGPGLTARIECRFKIAVLRTLEALKLVWARLLIPWAAWTTRAGAKLSLPRASSRAAPSAGP